jgi:hypothetical protein
MQAKQLAYFESFQERMDGMEARLTASQQEPPSSTQLPPFSQLGMASQLPPPSQFARPTLPQLPYALPSQFSIAPAYGGQPQFSQPANAVGWISPGGATAATAGLVLRGLAALAALASGSSQSCVVNVLSVREYLRLGRGQSVYYESNDQCLRHYYPLTHAICRDLDLDLPLSSPCSGRKTSSFQIPRLTEDTTGQDNHWPQGPQCCLEYQGL